MDAVIWHVGRCGSSVLGNCLNQHSQLQWENEVFNRWMPHNSGGAQLPLITDEIQAIRARRQKSIQIVEVKMLDCQHPGLFGLDAARLGNELRFAGYGKSILLERKNILKRMISHHIGIYNKVYHLDAKELPPKPQKVILPIKEMLVGTQTRSLLDWIVIIDFSYREMEAEMRSKGEFLHLYYERDIEADPLSGYRKACAFLGVDQEPADILLRKTNPYSIADRLANYDEVRDLLAPTEFSWMLKEEQQHV